MSRVAAKRQYLTQEPRVPLLELGRKRPKQQLLRALESSHVHMRLPHCGFACRGSGMATGSSWLQN